MPSASMDSDKRTPVDRLPDRCVYCGQERFGLQDKTATFRCGTTAKRGESRWEWKRSGSCMKYLQERWMKRARTNG